MTIQLSNSKVVKRAGSLKENSTRLGTAGNFSLSAEIGNQPSNS
jgi:hypothetical protein